MSDPIAATDTTAARPRRLFLLERFWPGVTPALAEEAVRRLERVAAELVGPDAAVYLRSALLPGDEVVFSLVEAGSVSAVRELSGRAAFDVDRISENIPIGRIVREACE